MLKNEALIDLQPQLNANIGEDIGYELGAKMIKDYFDKFQEGGSQFVGRNVIEKILLQPGCIGINIYKGLNENGEKNYVITGVNQDGQPLVNFTVVNPDGELNKELGIVADRNVGGGWFDFAR